MIEALFFYMFSSVLLGAGLMVVVSRNPVFSVLFLILAFLGLFGSQIVKLITGGKKAAD